jgi:hypothetical protein
MRFPSSHDRFVTSFISTCCSVVSFHPHVDFVFIYIVASFERKEKILFWLFLSIITLVFTFSLYDNRGFLKKKENAWQASKIHYYSTQSLFLFVKHIHLHYEILLCPAGEKGREREKDLKSSRQKKRENKRKLQVFLLQTLYRCRRHRSPCCPRTKLLSIVSSCRKESVSIWRSTHKTYTHTQLVPAEQSLFYFSFVCVVSQR